MYNYFILDDNLLKQYYKKSDSISSHLDDRMLDNNSSVLHFLY